MDSIIPASTKISLIKIDVEGAELGVLKGAKNLLQRDKPIVIFECGMGASDYYGTQPEDVFRFLNNEAGLKISLLQNWLHNKQPLTVEEFVVTYRDNREYYFIAHP